MMKFRAETTRAIDLKLSTQNVELSRSSLDVL